MGREHYAVTRLLKIITAESPLFSEWLKGKHLAVTHDLLNATAIRTGSGAANASRDNC